MCIPLPLFIHKPVTLLHCGIDWHAEVEDHDGEGGDAAEAIETVCAGALGGYYGVYGSTGTDIGCGVLEDAGCGEKKGALGCGDHGRTPRIISMPVRRVTLAGLL